MTTEQFKFIERITRHWFIRHLFSKDILEFVACQFALESDFGTSHLALTQNNYCGMKVPHLRVSYGLLTVGTGFQSYDSFDTCVIDWCVWFFNSKPYANVVYDLDAFKLHLRNTGYCPEKDYIDKINLIYSQLKNYQNGKR